jgi:helix-hairpin-helix protein
MFKTLIRIFAVVFALMLALSTAYAADQVNVNTASESEIEALPGVGAKYAPKIIANRPYTSAADLSKAGLSKRKISKLTPMITFEGGSAAVAPAPAAAASSSETTAATPPTKERSPKTSKANREESNEVASSSAETPPQPGMVWANTKTKVYHTAGDRYYGKTKSGKWMSEDDAVKAGYRKDKLDK